MDDILESVPSVPLTVEMRLPPDDEEEEELGASWKLTWVSSVSGFDPGVLTRFSLVVESMGWLKESREFWLEQNRISSTRMKM